jgi:hypothetical protein
MQRQVVIPGLLAVLMLVLPAAAWASDSRELGAMRALTAQYHRLNAAQENGFVPLHDCISHPTKGAIGVHYVMPERLKDAKLDLASPEALIYEVLPDGRARLAAVQYIIPAALWTEARPPELMGQPLAYRTTMGDVAIDPSYVVHVWAWRRNPSGMFADWNPEVTCPAD